jgi:hypothetical protein
MNQGSFTKLNPMPFDNESHEISKENSILNLMKLSYAIIIIKMYVARIIGVEQANDLITRLNDAQDENAILNATIYAEEADNVFDNIYIGQDGEITNSEKGNCVKFKVEKVTVESERLVIGENTITHFLRQICHGHRSFLQKDSWFSRLPNHSFRIVGLMLDSISDTTHASEHIVQIMTLVGGSTDKIANIRINFNLSDISNSDSIGILSEFTSVVREIEQQEAGKKQQKEEQEEQQTKREGKSCGRCCIDFIFLYLLPFGIIISGCVIAFGNVICAIAQQSTIVKLLIAVSIVIGTLFVRIASKGIINAISDGISSAELRKNGPVYDDVAEERKTQLLQQPPYE